RRPSALFPHRFPVLTHGDLGQNSLVSVDERLLAGLRAQEPWARALFLLASPSQRSKKHPFQVLDVSSVETRLAFVLLDRCGAAPDSHRIPFFTDWEGKAHRFGTKGVTEHIVVRLFRSTNILGYSGFQWSRFSAPLESFPEELQK